MRVPKLITKMLTALFTNVYINRLNKPFDSFAAYFSMFVITRLSIVSITTCKRWWNKPEIIVIRHCLQSFYRWHVVRISSWGARIPQRNCWTITTISTNTGLTWRYYPATIRWKSCKPFCEISKYSLYWKLFVLNRNHKYILFELNRCILFI